MKTEEEAFFDPIRSRKEKTTRDLEKFFARANSMRRVMFFQDCAIILLLFCLVALGLAYLSKGCP